MDASCHPAKEAGVVLHELLTLTRPLHVLDLETTSLDIDQARIVEIGFQTWTAMGMQHEWRSLVNPGVPITNSSSHHVTDDDVTHKCRKCSKYREEHRDWPGNVAVNPIECPEFHPVPYLS